MQEPLASAPSGDARTAGSRLPAIDVLRGFVMVVMALDHTRDYWSNASYDPTDLAQTSTAMFLTRWITHLCAPVFVLLAGTSAALSLGRGRDRAALARFLVSRGLWLVLLELTLVNLCWKGARIDAQHFRAMVIWMLGWSMVALAGLQYLPRWALVTFGVVLVAGHNAFDTVTAASLPHGWLWTILHEPGVIGSWQEGVSLFVLYPLVPWVGVMALGYAFGSWLRSSPLRDDTRVRQRWFFAIGLAMLVAFVVLRAIDIYGDAQHWTLQTTRTFTVLSFLDVTKYPPSLAYLLVTLGIAMLLLVVFERARGWLVDVLSVFGRVPMFFYIVHIMLLGRAADLGYRLQLGHWQHRGDRELFGFGLPGVYAVWLLAVIALYPLCRWYLGVKTRHGRGWLSYL
jgi:uncharacterized membrane protein